MLLFIYCLITSSSSSLDTNTLTFMHEAVGCGDETPLPSVNDAYGGGAIELRLRHSINSVGEEREGERLTSAFSGITPQSIRKRFSFNSRSKPSIKQSTSIVMNKDTEAATATHEEKKKKAEEESDTFESGANVSVMVVSPGGTPATFVRRLSVNVVPRDDARCLLQPDSLSVNSGVQFIPVDFTRVAFYFVILLTI